MKSGRVVIVGGGVIGLCTAYYALKRGFSVTVIEREAAGGDNCSMGNAGMIVPSHFIPLAAPGMIAKGLRMMLNPQSRFHSAAARSRAAALGPGFSISTRRNAMSRHRASCYGI